MRQHPQKHCKCAHLWIWGRGVMVMRQVCATHMANGEIQAPFPGYGVCAMVLALFCFLMRRWYAPYIYICADNRLHRISRKRGSWGPHIGGLRALIGVSKIRIDF